MAGQIRAGIEKGDVLFRIGLLSASASSNYSAFCRCGSGKQRQCGTRIVTKSKSGSRMGAVLPYLSRPIKKPADSRPLLSASGVASRAPSVSAGSESSSRSLFCHIFLTRTGIHFA